MLILIRHGKSQWNLENRFTGWVDVDLCEEGVEEAKRASETISKLNLESCQVFSSKLLRANRTRDIILNHNPTIKILSNIDHQALNERHYGELQGMNKDEARKIYGAEQVRIWRRSYDIPPNGGESLKTTGERVIPYFIENIQPLLEKNENVMIVAHGNSLRALIMHLKKLTSDEILQYEIPTGVPIII